VTVDREVLRLRVLNGIDRASGHTWLLQRGERDMLAAMHAMFVSDPGPILDRLAQFLPQSFAQITEEEDMAKKQNGGSPATTPPTPAQPQPAEGAQPVQGIDLAWFTTLLSKLGTAAPILVEALKKLEDLFKTPVQGVPQAGDSHCDHAACCDAVIEAQARALVLCIRHRAACQAGG
jgi:hypothetical protein